MSESPEDRYWSSAVSTVTADKVFVRGYDLESLIGTLPFTAAIYLLIRGHLPSPAQSRVLDGVLSAVLDFALEKPGTVAARYAVSGNPSMAAGLAAACLSVGQHTLATEPASTFILKAHAEFLGTGLSLERFAEREVLRMRAAGERIPGIGHPVFKRIDPRGQVLKELAVREGCWGQPAELYEAIHTAFVKLPGKQDIPINDVGVMAAVLVGLGFTPAEGTGIAVLSTIPGVVAHISEELQSRRPIRVVTGDQVDYQVATDRDFRSDWADAGWSSDSNRPGAASDDVVRPLQQVT